jgi:Ca-activated chloride channel family protein
MGGLLREVCTKVSLGIDPAEGVKILDVLNDFDRTSTGKYRLPNLLAGESLDVIVRVLLPGGPGGRAPVFKAVVGWVSQGSEERRYAEEEAFIAYVPTAEAETQENHMEVVKIRQLLGSARARRQAMAEMDAGEYTAAQNILGEWAQSSQVLFNRMPDQDLDMDSRELKKLLQEIEDNEDMKFSRKKMMYQCLYQQRSRKKSPPKKGNT